MVFDRLFRTVPLGSASRKGEAAGYSSITAPLVSMTV